MLVGQIEVIARAVQVGRHRRQVLRAVLPVICQRYLKIPRIHCLKNPQSRPEPSILTRGVGMLRLEGFMEIQQLHHEGVSVSEIARRLNMDRKTVRKYLRQALRAYERKPKRWKVDPFRTYLRERWEVGVVNAFRLFAEIQKRGYAGGNYSGEGRRGAVAARGPGGVHLCGSRPRRASRRRWTGGTLAAGVASGCTGLR
jgi:hypothetical protein